MEQIEKELGRKIMRIETNDLDEMEEVSFYIPSLVEFLANLHAQKMKQALK